MTLLASPLPARRTDLVIRPIGEGGRYVVKLPGTHDYFQIGEQEHFLLQQLDGQQDSEDVCRAFQTRFGEPLSEDDFDGFVDMARERRLLAPIWEYESAGDISGVVATEVQDKPKTDVAPVRQRQNILYWRKRIVDPDRLFDWLEPKIRFFWTRAFLILSSACIVWATLLLWSGRGQVATSFSHALRWETLLLAWLVTIAVGVLHESAHGLTCKHYGGEVHEIGFLLMYFMPCFYCNVSDAWLLSEKSKRMWVTFAGGYFELFLWSLAVFVWRLTMPDTLLNYLAFIVLTVSGVESFFNFNPLIKLDGYYLLSDWMEIPNLRKRSLEQLMSCLRRLLWGAARPEAQQHARFLLWFGLISWTYSLTFVLLMLSFLHHWFRDLLGLLALPLVCGLGVLSLRGLLGSLFQEEFLTMLWRRHLRTVVWAASLAGVVGGSFLIPWTDYAGGDFEVRATTHVELRAPVAGFLQAVHYEEGQAVLPGREVARLEIPDLASRIARQEAELREAEAKLRLLQAGPRDEEVTQQRRRVEAAQAWRDVANRTLEQEKLAFQQELIRFDKLLEEYTAECDYAQQLKDRHEQLLKRNALSQDDYAASKRACLIACARRDQAAADRRSREATGTLAAQSALAEREKGLTQEQAILALFQAGTRPEEIDAAQATVERLREELSCLQDQRDRLSMTSTASGVITTSRLRERVGDYFEEGDLICEVEDARQMEVVIALSEDQATRVRPGQKVRLKARSLPFEVIEVEVERVAPCANGGDVQSTLNVYCHLDDPSRQLRSGMTGYARIQCRQAPLANVLAAKCLRFLRTEFWW